MPCNGTWCRPLRFTPTTHILKLPLGRIPGYEVDLSDSVENEWLCARVARELGLDVAATEMGRFGNERALVVERFDRQWLDRDVAGPLFLVRLPQEDMCQAPAARTRRPRSTTSSRPGP